MTDMTVAKTILAQLGGNMFRLLTGSKDFVGGENSLKFKVGRNPKKVTHVSITLDASDTYTVQFMKWNGRKLEMKVIESLSMVYCDMLQDVFEAHTGLYVTMNARG